eukprot:TRINITY_DN1177_c0_g1_i1.p1 TRINITY_DN1177_c0_g1~~TRINITY_DN1177_c0_g1_i1.p1  ORF type:complete len:373 (+),score=79.47 TRINITY_DN1177_c0_g1_i1:43-1119(+)
MDAGAAVGLTFGLIFAAIGGFFLYRYFSDSSPQVIKREKPADVPQDHRRKRRSAMRDTIRRANKMANKFKQRSSTDVIDRSARPSLAHVEVEMEHPQPSEPSQDPLQATQIVGGVAAADTTDNGQANRRTLRLDTNEMLDLDGVVVPMEIPSLDKHAYNAAALERANKQHDADVMPLSTPSDTTRLSTQSSSVTVASAAMSHQPSNVSVVSKSSKVPPPVAPKPPKSHRKSKGKQRPVPKPPADALSPDNLEELLYQDPLAEIPVSVVIDNTSSRASSDCVDMYDGITDPLALKPDVMMQSDCMLQSISDLEFDRPWSRQHGNGSRNSDHLDTVSVTSTTSSVVFRLRRPEEVAETEA